MKYFIDTEFIEGFHGTYSNGKKAHTIQLVSIAIFCENGMEFYAISNEFNPDDADEWLKENVLSKLWPSLKIDELKCEVSDHSGDWEVFDNKVTGHVMIFPKDEKHDTPEKAITGAITYAKNSGIVHLSLDEIKSGILNFIDRCESVDDKKSNIKFYAYYADYDWVAFCSIFGRMIDLPKGFPMYCIDLKQMFDALPVEKGVGNINLEYFEKNNLIKNKEIEESKRGRFEWNETFAWSKGVHFVEDKFGKFVISNKYINSLDPLKIDYKNHEDYPVIPAAMLHDARYDAVWNYKLYWFIKKINFGTEIESDLREIDRTEHQQFPSDRYFYKKSQSISHY